MPPPYVDDPSIKDEDDLWRRVPHWHFVKDENLGRVRPSSAAFDDDVEKETDGSRKPMSAFVARVVRAAGLGEIDVLAGHTGFGMVSFTAALARQNNLGIQFEPSTLPGHAVVFGKKTDKVRKNLYKNCAWIVPPPPVPPATG